jgi:Flp pilus assembly protein TadD
MLVADYEKKFRLAPRDPEVLFALGVFYAKLAKPEKALWAFGRSWGLDHRRYDSLYNLASAYEVNGDSEKAHWAYEKLVSNDDPANTYRQAAEERLQQMTAKK